MKAVSKAITVDWPVTDSAEQAGGGPRWRPTQRPFPFAASMAAVAASRSLTAGNAGGDMGGEYGDIGGDVVVDQSSAARRHP